MTTTTKATPALVAVLEVIADESCRNFFDVAERSGFALQTCRLRASQARALGLLAPYNGSLALTERGKIALALMHGRRAYRASLKAQGF